MDGSSRRNSEEPTREIGIELSTLNLGNLTARADTSPLDQASNGIDRAGPDGRPPARPVTRTWWSRNVRPTVTHEPNGGNGHSNDPRDYLALERTYLAHIRTANALALFGVALLQLFRLNNVDNRAGTALGAICAGGGIILTFIGGWRYFLQQKKILHGRTVTGGAEAWILGTLVFGITTAAFVIVLIVD